MKVHVINPFINPHYYHYYPNLRLNRSLVSLNFALPLGTDMVFDIAKDFELLVVSTILFLLNMSEASRIISPYFEEEGITDAERADPPRADKFPAFNAARSIASARRRADNEFAFCSVELLLPGDTFDEVEGEEASFA